jgi:predicted aldo/keto reductase-like oxidoreductase
MPVFSCGGMRYQHKWQDCPLSEVPAGNQENLEATIRRSIELGINHIETARGYGSSERQLGLVLPKCPRDELIVQTKIPPHADPSVFVAQFEESLERLRLDYVDLLAIHGINNHELLWWSVREGGCLRAARDLVDQGKARHIGFSTHGSCDVIKTAIECEQFDGFDYVNLHWYYIFQQNWPAIEAAAERDMGVFIISPSEKGGMLFEPPRKLIDLCQPLHPLVFNILFCLSHPQVHTLSVGASKPEDFDLQLTSLELLEKADELAPPIAERLRQAMIDALGEVAATRYTEGLPPWDLTPGCINIPTILWLRNLAIGLDLVDYAKMRYNLLGNGEHWFPGVGAAMASQLDLTKAVADSPLKDEIPGWLTEAHEMLFEAPQKRLSES